MSYSNTTTATGPIPNRRPSFNPTTSAGPRLYDWAKTDNRAARPSNGHKARSGSITSVPRAAVPASLPANAHLAAQLSRASIGLPSPGESAVQDFDDDFEGDEEDGADGEDDSAMDLDMEDEDGEVKPEWRKLALGTGSGGVKGRRKGEVFRCEKCGKVSGAGFELFRTDGCRTTSIRAVYGSTVGSIVLTGRNQARPA